VGLSVQVGILDSPVKLLHNAPLKMLSWIVPVLFALPNLILLVPQKECVGLSVKLGLLDPTVILRKSLLLERHLRPLLLELNQRQHQKPVPHWMEYLH
jgi:hypothetical protein